MLEFQGTVSKAGKKNGRRDIQIQDWKAICKASVETKRITMHYRQRSKHVATETLNAVSAIDIERRTLLKSTAAVCAFGAIAAKADTATGFSDGARIVAIVEQQFAESISFAEYFRDAARVSLDVSLRDLPDEQTFASADIIVGLTRDPVAMIVGQMAMAAGLQLLHHGVHVVAGNNSTHRICGQCKYLEAVFSRNAEEDWAHYLARSVAASGMQSEATVFPAASFADLPSGAVYASSWVWKNTKGDRS